MPVRAIRKSAAGRAGKLGLSLAAAMALAGCELLQQLMPEEPAPAATSNETSPAETVVAQPAAKPKPPAAVVKKQSLEPQSLIGLGEEQITRKLGQPREVRNDPPAMVWNYAIGDCRLDLFFYLDLKSQDFRALSYNFDPNSASDGAKKACLDKLQEANRELRR